ncbi:Ribosome production factor [Penicillium angulare]|uniref:Ribosome production factor n=1 Tax=Penicillium angulare TaxID=116970 RepID=UPI00253FD91E|nr:Ribosome production factor [Penicillium angulare]KAJ5291077.1 Ribosome production factor [Penicillium angulare]
MLREVKPKNPRTARILKAREPQLIEGPKKTLLLHGTKCPQALDTVLKTFNSLTKPNSVLFHKKNANVHPFENTESLEFMANKNDCGLVVYGSSNKKRPNCVTLARIFDSQLLDLCELLLLPPADGSSIPPINELVMHVGQGLRPMMLFAGSPWDDPTSSAHVMLKSFFLDLFKGEETDRIDVEGLQYVMMVGAEEAREGLSPIVHLRWYKVVTKRSGHKLPRVELDGIGPKFDFKIGRTRPAAADLMKQALKQGKRPNEEGRTKKNITMDSMGDKVGRVHLTKQDLSDLQTRKMKGLKRRADGESDEGEDMMDVDDDDDDEISEDEGHKRARTN